MNVLDKLSIRIKDRWTISVVEDKYDGAIPAESSSPVTINQDIFDLLWTLLDYPVISRCLSKPQTVSTDNSVASQVSPCTPVLAETSTTAGHNLGVLQAAQVEESNYLSANGGPARTIQLGTQDLLLEQIPDWDAYQGFNNDWSFFGRPWTAYTTNDGWYAQT